MENDLIAEKSWFKKNWIWISLAVFLTVFIFVVLFNSNSKNGLSDTVTALKEEALYEKAVDLANNDATVLKTIGKIAPIDKLAILEGNATYAQNNTFVTLSVRVKGAKKQAKAEVQATKKGVEWQYKKITIRTKNPKEEIIVLDQS